MDPTFESYIRDLDLKVDQLLGARPHAFTTLPRGVPKSGVYLFTDAGRHLYVGRSNRIRGRLGSHCKESSRHNAASLAFRIARERTGHIKASYSSKGSRAALCELPEFFAAFRDAKAYLRSLEIRFVEEPHQTRQALLEIYAAVRLQTPYNDFATH